MEKTKEIHVPGGADIFKHLAKELSPYYEDEVCSNLFIVEGTIDKPRVGIRYPGKKLQKRILKKPNKKSALWANIFDFEVVPFNDNIECSSVLFTYERLLKDFDENKKDSNVFWELLEGVYKENLIKEEPPNLEGIDSRQFLEMLKWMWIQEDLNYKLTSQEVESPIRYRLQNKNGSVTSGGAGRKKFYAALLLVRHHGFNHAEMRKITR